MNTARSAAWTAPGECGELTSIEMANVRHLAEARVVLVAVAMLVALLEPAGEHRPVALALLGVYAALGLRELRRLHAGGEEDPFPVNHWVDLACYMPVAAMTGGLSSPYNVFLLFPVFAACLRSGLPVGLLVAAVCGATLGGIGTVSGGGGGAGRFVDDLAVAPLLLGLVVAVVIARWTHTEITIVRRLAFINGLSQLFTPQHDLRRAITQLCDMLRAYQRAENCVVMLKDTRSAGWLLFEIDGGENPVRGDVMDAAVVHPLLIVPMNRSVLYRAHGFFTTGAVCEAFDARTLRPSNDVDCASVAGLAQLLEADSLVSLPLQSRTQTIGRLHLTSRGLGHRRNDLEFLSQVATQVGLMIENMQLVERLALEVADEERKKISRDLHDGTIQPYIGLKLGLEALHRKVADPVLVHEVDDLIKMAGDGISQLRNYVGHLSSTGQRSRRSLLLPAIRRQAEKFSEYYGIPTEVLADTDVAVRGALLEEVMHLVREGLSNIRRHTHARAARIEVETVDGRLTLRFRNDTGAGGEPAPQPFLPRSLSERARELGGTVRVDHSLAGTTVVSIELPV